MAIAVGTTRGSVEQWCQRNSIPSKWLVSVVSAAERAGIELTTDCLAEIIAIHSRQPEAQDAKDALTARKRKDSAFSVEKTRALSS